MAPSLNSAYVACGCQLITRASLGEGPTVAYSTLFPKKTPTLSPFFTPTLMRPWAKALLCRSSSSYVKVVCWWRDITLRSVSPRETGKTYRTAYAGRSPCAETIDVKCCPTVCSRRGGYASSGFCDRYLLHVSIPQLVPYCTLG